MDTIPKWLTEQHKNIMLAFRRMNGRGHISDVRRAANVNAGDPLANKLVADGLMQKTDHDSYRLTEDGYAMANLLIARGE